MNGKKFVCTITSALILFAQQATCMLACSQEIAANKTETPSEEFSTNLKGQATYGLTPGALEAANLLGITDHVRKAIALREAAGNRDFGVMSEEEMALKVALMDKIMGEVLEVRVAADRIDRELSWDWTAKGGLEAKRQKTLNYLFTANFMQGGILGVCAGGQFLHENPKAGAELLLLASSIGLGLSAMSVAAARSGTKPIDGETTMLADLFGIKYEGELHHPDVILKFLNSVPPGSASNLTRKDKLIKGWKQGHYLKSTDEKNLIKMAAVQPQGEQLKENIGLLANRIRLLYDTQSSLEELDGELLDLLRALD